MNANELADALQETEPYYSTDYKLFDKAAAMLRQQAKELDEAGHMIGVLREQLQEEIQARANALDDLNNRMMKFMKSYNEMAWKLEEVGGAYICGGVWLLLVHYVCLCTHWLERGQRNFIVRVME
jgi:cell fate (sporulation/competence/biofilm development) regulator YlbF (YheA/YmcA/DUF963 family)